MNLIKQLDHLNMTVRDLAQTQEWYRRVFGFQTVEAGFQDGQPWAIIKAGEAMLCLYQRPDLRFVGRFERPLHGVNHLAFRITDRDAWLGIVAREQLKLNYGDHTDYSHSTSWYVEDPTGYEIEVALWEGDRVVFEPMDTERSQPSGS